MIYAETKVTIFKDGWKLSIRKNLNYNKLNFQIDTETGLDLYAINGRPSSDTSNADYVNRISFGAGLSFKDFIGHSRKSSFLIKPKIQYSTFSQLMQR